MNPVSAGDSARFSTGLDDAALELLECLICIPSLSGKEGAASSWLVGRMKEFGLRAEVDAAGNAVGVIGDPSPGARELVLLGHIDTVPGEIPVRREADLLYGRGAVDAKGPLCAFIAGAARAALPAAVRIVVIGAVEEECATSRGARHVAERYRPEACIIGEPSGWDGITLGYKGRLLVEARAQRDSAHTAGPDASPADELFSWWKRVRAWVEAMNDGSSRIFDQVQASIRAISSQNDGLAEAAMMTAGFRLPLAISPHEAEAAVRSCIDQSASHAPHLAFSGHERAHATDRSDPLVRLFSAAIRAAGAAPRPKLKTGTSDMNVVAPVWRCPIVAYGPGDSALDHTPNEHISLGEYLASIGVVRRVIEAWALEPALSDPGAAIMD